MEIKKLFDDNFDFAFKATTYNNMKVAIQSFEQFKKIMKTFSLLIKEKLYLDIY